MYREDFSGWETFSSRIDPLTFFVNEGKGKDGTKRTDAKMREEMQEESVCLLKIQRGRRDIIAPSDDLWQH